VAGIGLNITAANHVIHYTRPWNPAKENQATDRVHRIGQSKLVKVYYPFVKDQRFVTVEERLDELIRSKEDLARDVLRPSTETKIKAEDLLDCLELPKK
jgi:SNF2 family DNA or RNA helicase